MTVDLNRLLEVCEKFIIDNRISCEEVVFYEERVQEHAPRLVATLCEIIGYYDSPENDDNNSNDGDGD